MPALATELALTMVAFIQAQPRLSSPAFWWLVPTLTRLRRSEVLQALDAMPKPVVLAPMVEQGMIGVWSFNSLSDRDRARLEHDRVNHAHWAQRGLEQLAPGSLNPPILLELEADEIVFHATDLHAWARDYLIMTSGWTLADSGGDPRAPVRLLLRGADGTWSPGGTCAHPS